VAAVCLVVFASGCNPNLFLVSGCETGKPCPPPEPEVDAKIDASKEIGSHDGSSDSKDAVGNDGTSDSTDSSTDSSDSTVANDGETTEKCKYEGLIEGIWSSDQNWWEECEVKTEHDKNGKCYVLFVDHVAVYEENVKLNSDFTHMYTCPEDFGGECGGFTRKVK